MRAVTAFEFWHEFCCQFLHYWSKEKLVFIVNLRAGLQESKKRQVAVDASKLSQFLGQIQTIQEKVNTLQRERKSSMQRMDAIEVGPACVLY